MNPPDKDAARAAELLAFSFQPECQRSPSAARRPAAGGPLATALAGPGPVAEERAQPAAAVAPAAPLPAAAPSHSTHSQSRSQQSRRSKLSSGSKGGGSTFAAPRGRAAKAAQTDTTLHPVLRAGWQPLCSVVCNGLTGDFLGGHGMDLYIRCTAPAYAGLPLIDVNLGGCIMTCSQFERAAGRELSKKWKESIHVVGEGVGSVATLISWMKRRAAQDHGAKAVGKLVWVCWCADSEYYQGRITSYSRETGKHTVHYSDSHSEELHLPVELLSFDPVKPRPAPALPAAAAVFSQGQAARQQQQGAGGEGQQGGGGSGHPPPWFALAHSALEGGQADEELRPPNPLWHQGSGISVTSSFQEEHHPAVPGVPRQAGGPRRTSPTTTPTAATRGRPLPERGGPSLPSAPSHALDTPSLNEATRDAAAAARPAQGGGGECGAAVAAPAATEAGAAAGGSAVGRVAVAEPVRPGSAAAAQLLHLPGGCEDASTPRAIPQTSQPSRLAEGQAAGRKRGPPVREASEEPLFREVSLTIPSAAELQATANAAIGAAAAAAPPLGNSGGLGPKRTRSGGMGGSQGSAFHSLLAPHEGWNAAPGSLGTGSVFVGRPLRHQPSLLSQPPLEMRQPAGAQQQQQEQQQQQLGQQEPGAAGQLQAVSPLLETAGSRGGSCDMATTWASMLAEAAAIAAELRKEQEGAAAAAQPAAAEARQEDAAGCAPAPLPAALPAGPARQQQPVVPEGQAPMQLDPGPQIEEAAGKRPGLGTQEAAPAALQLAQQAQQAPVQQRTNLVEVPPPPPAGLEERDATTIARWLHGVALQLEPLLSQAGAALATRSHAGGCCAAPPLLGPSLGARFQARLALARGDGTLRGIYEAMLCRYQFFSHDASQLQAKLCDLILGLLHEVHGSSPACGLAPAAQAPAGRLLLGTAPF